MTVSMDVMEGYYDEMDRSQKVTHFRIDGDPMPRVRFGDEDNRMSLANCPECGAGQGMLHIIGCTTEVCPLCECSGYCACGYQGPIYED